MKDLADKIRDKRRQKLDIDGGFSIVFSRPSDEEMVKAIAADYTLLEYAQHFVVDWIDVKESDVLRGGSSDRVDFTRAAWVEVLADQPEWWAQIGNAIIESHTKYRQAKGETVKN